jgi:hypothetical protein
MIRRNLAGLAGLAAACLAASSVQAAVLVNDTWLDGTDTDPAAPQWSEAGADSDADGDLESAWYQGGGGTLNPLGLGGPLRGEMAAGSSSSWTTFFTPDDSPVTLTNAGDELRVTWVFTLTDVNASNTSQNLRIAVVDTPSGQHLGADGTPGSGAYTGYGIFGNMGQTFDHSDPFELVERADDSGALLSSSGEWEDDLLAAKDGIDGNAGYAAGVQYTFLMTITRNASSNLDISASMTGGNLDGDGSLSVAVSNVAPNRGSYTFDTFALRPSTPESTAAIIDTNLFKAEFIPIPEPAAAALVGLGALSLAGIRRRA